MPYACSCDVRRGSVLHCSRSNDKAINGSLERQIVSKPAWASVNDICFSDDGHVRSVIDTQAGRVVMNGTYRLEGNRLTLTVDSDPPRIATVRIDGDTLTLTYDGDKTEYRRMSVRCEGPN